MFIKYVVKRAEETIVIKFDIRNNSIYIGGYISFIDLVNTVMQKEYFKKYMSNENVHSQRNKVKYKGEIKGLSEFILVMEKIKEDFDCKQVKRVERLI